MQDSTLASLARTDSSAFAELYRRYVGLIYRFLFHRLADSHLAEDLTAQVFLEALESLGRYRERGTFAAWLFTIARNKAIAEYRRSQPTRSLDEAQPSVDPHDPPGAAIEMAEQRERLATLLSQLSKDQREILELRFAASLTFREIGLVLEKSEGSAKMALYRALDELREKWEANDA